MLNEAETEQTETPARDWVKILARYREPVLSRSIFEIFVTIIPFVLLWIAAWQALQISVWLTLALDLLAAGFLLRIFMIQHDCGHGAFFRKKVVNDWVGRVAGVLTLTPYDVWRRAHSIHHGTSGDLDRRGFGDIDTLTIREYHSRTAFGRFAYRLYRNPFVLFVIGPAYLFILQNRLPTGFMRDGWLYWASAMGTNLAIAALFGGLIYLVGLEAFLWVHLPITLIAASIGVWLFYVQHQFEDTYWDETPSWAHHDAALYGSSHYDLPVALRWITANIGIHHVHHLYSRIPFYRLQEVLNDNPELSEVRRLTFWQSLSCIRLRLWDEDSRRLLSFGEARKVAVAS